MTDFQTSVCMCNSGIRQPSILEYCENTALLTPNMHPLKLSFNHSSYLKHTTLPRGVIYLQASVKFK